MAVTMAEIRVTLDELAVATKNAELARERTERSLELLSKDVRRVTQNVGGINGSIGEIIQMIVIPGVMEKMNELGHNFTMTSAEKKFYKTDGDRLLEVDLLLENCQDVMVVEVKTRVNLGKVEWHLERLRLLRKNENITGMTGKTMYAAIAGIEFDKDARKLAVESGMYLIEIENDGDNVKVTPPPEKAGVW